MVEKKRDRSNMIVQVDSELNKQFSALAAYLNPNLNVKEARSLLLEEAMRNRIDKQEAKTK